jgi:hypothetical protein
MRLWLDDLRDPMKVERWGAGREVHMPSEGWTWVRNYDQATAALATGEVTYASLDHDLEFDCKECAKSYKRAFARWEEWPLHRHKNGYDVVCWMRDHNVWPVDGVRVHSANYHGGMRMRELIDEHYRATVCDGAGI